MTRRARRVHFRTAPVRLRTVAASLLGRDWRDAAGAPWPYTRDARHGAKLWGDMVRAGRVAGRACAGRYIEIHYEDLVRRPEATLRRLCDAIGEPWSPAMLAFRGRLLQLVGAETDSAQALRRPMRTRAIGRWRRDLDPDTRAIVQRLLAPVLEEFGYGDTASRRSA